jgi:hypothetical protein
MYHNPDWDPLKIINDLTINLEAQSHLTLSISQQLNNLAQQINNQNQAITQIVEYYNVLNRRIAELEQKSSA